MEWDVLKQGCLATLNGFFFSWEVIKAYLEGRCSVMIHPIWVTQIDGDLFMQVGGEFFVSGLLSFHPYLAIQLPLGWILLWRDFFDLDNFY